MFEQPSRHVFSLLLCFFCITILIAVLSASGARSCRDRSLGSLRPRVSRGGHEHADQDWRRGREAAPSACPSPQMRPATGFIAAIRFNHPALWMELRRDVHTDIVYHSLLFWGLKLCQIRCIDADCKEQSLSQKLSARSRRCKHELVDLIISNYHLSIDESDKRTAFFILCRAGSWLGNTCQILLSSVHPRVFINSVLKDIWTMESLIVWFESCILLHDT